MYTIRIYIYIYIFKKYKMLRVSAETFAKNSIMFATSQIKKKICGYVNKDIGEKLYVQNIYDLVDKEIKGK